MAFIPGRLRDEIQTIVTRSRSLTLVDECGFAPRLRGPDVYFDSSQGSQYHGEQT
jgi:hypothetical protein